MVGHSAKDAIEGLALTSANYEEAVAILQKRFGNDKLIISKHMETLLGVGSVSTADDVAGLRRMYDKIESQIRGLRSLGVTSSSYGALLTPVLQIKLPPELRLIVNRELTESWELDKFIETLALELEVRERSVASSRNYGGNKIPKKGQHTSATFMTGNQSNCVYCSHQGHTSEQCHLIREVEARWQILKASGRCFLCLKKGHMSRRCQSSNKCNHCKGTHHVSLCHKKTTGTNESTTEEKSKSHTSTKPALNPQASPFEKPIRMLHCLVTEKYCCRLHEQ